MANEAAHGATEELNRIAVSATVHCLTGCAIGEVLGLAGTPWYTADMGNELDG
jgi:hypothetical protein